MKAPVIAGVEVSSAALKHGLVRADGRRIGRVREAGVGNFRALDNSARLLGTYGTKAGAAEAVILNARKTGLLPEVTA